MALPKRGRPAHPASARARGPQGQALRAARGAGLDRHCARAASKGARRDEETLPRRTKKLDFSCPIRAAVLITHSTGEGGLTADQNDSHIL
jgi:hypothetical protein